MIKKKKPSKVAIKKPMTIDTIGKLCFAVSEAYSKDPSKPALLLSWLSNGEFYGSICRFHQKFGEGKQVVFTAKACSPGEAVRELAKLFVTQQNALLELKKAL